jgi:transposase
VCGLRIARLLNRLRCLAEFSFGGGDHCIGPLFRVARSKTHEAIAKAKTEIQHRILTHYLPLYFPEIERFRGNSRSDWFFAFLDAFPTPASITSLSKEVFIEAAWDVVGRKVSKQRLLADIYETARTSIGLPLPTDASAIRMFRMVIAEARSLIRQRNEIERMADDLLIDSADYQALRRVPGIGPIIALTILAEGATSGVSAIIASS